MQTDRVRALFDFAQISDFVSQWSKLGAGDGAGIFCSPDWVLPAWRHLSALGTPFALAVLGGERLVVFLPLTLSERPGGGRLVRAAGSPLTDKYDAVTQQPEACAGIPQLLEALERWLGARDVLEIPALDRRGCLASALRTYAALPSPKLRVTWDRPEPSPVIRLDHVKDVQDLLSPRRRRGWANRYRWLAGQGTVQIIRMESSADLHPAVRAFVRRRLTNWQRRGRLDHLPTIERTPGFEEFLAEACSRLAVERRCHLAHLLINGQPIASDLYFRQGCTRLLYMRTYEPEWARASPGHLLFAAETAIALRESVRFIEFGRGDEPYKFALGASEDWLDAVVVTARQS